MPRTLLSSGIVRLPNLSALSAVGLAQQLATAALAKGKISGKPTKLLPNVKANLDAMEKRRVALQKVLGATAASPSTIHTADYEEDLAIRALHGVLAGWALLDGRTDLGTAASALLGTLFADGTAFINKAVLKEWATVEAKLAAVDATATATLDAVGATPLLAHLRSVHVVYGETIGATKVVVAPASPKVGKAQKALTEAIRQYLTSVAGSVVTDDKKSAAIADRLMKPYTAWLSPPKPKAKKGAAATTPAAMPTTAAGKSAGS